MSTHGDRNTLAIVIFALLALLLFPSCSTVVDTRVRISSEELSKK